MPDDKHSWIDYANLTAAIILGVIGILVAVYIGRSADRISRSNLLVTMATFLLDDSPKRQSAGVDMAQWAFAQYPQEVPEWAKRLISNAAREATGTAAGTPLLAPSTVHKEVEQSSDVPPGSPSASASTTSADRLFATVGGTLPRVYIQIASDEQRPTATQLRDALNQTLLNGDPLVVPKIQKVAPDDAPRNMELRYLKETDADEARQLAALLGARLNVGVVAKDLSKQFGSRNDIKARTYELWFPRKIAPVGAGAG